MSEAKWSPEPWRDDGAGAVEDATESTVFWFSDLPWSEDHGTARRIVACVNACAGIPTEALESGALGKALDVLLSCQQLAAGVAHASDVDRSEWTLHKGMADVRMHQAYDALRALGRLK